MNEDDVEIASPFCKSVVLHDYRGEDGFDHFGTDFCEHTVFAYSWGVGVLTEGQEHVSSGDAATDKAIERYVRRQAHPGMGEGIAALVQRRLGSQVEHVTDYAERGMGPEGGGPTYIVVFACAQSRRSCKTPAKGNCLGRRHKP